MLAISRGCDPNDFIDCVVQDTHEHTGWMLVWPHHTLPRLELEDSGVVTDRPCASCHRDGHGFTTSKAAILHLADAHLETIENRGLASTWEQFGKSGRDEQDRQTHLALPILLWSTQTWFPLLKDCARDVIWNPLLPS